MAKNFRRALLRGVGGIVMATAAAAAQASTFSVVHSFTGGADGSSPTGNMLADPNGNLFGTTTNVGTTGYGTVFRLAPGGALTVLHAFTAAEGYGATALQRDPSGNLYGAANEGGPGYFGTIFKVAPNGLDTVLYAFKGGMDGAYPSGPLIRGGSGALYGTASSRGAGDAGVVFRVAADGTQTVVHNFHYDAGGSDPGNLAGSNAARYGTAAYNGLGYGTVFKLVGSAETIVHNFTGADGNRPVGTLAIDASGNIYGATSHGGTSDLGTIYRIAANGTLTVLHAFLNTAGDGATPAGGLVLDTAGNLYGTTSQGGAFNLGTIFRIAPDGTETILHHFTGGQDGGSPAGALVASGRFLIGATAQGGAYSHGAVFKIAP